MLHIIVNIEEKETEYNKICEHLETILGEGQYVVWTEENVQDIFSVITPNDIVSWLYRGERYIKDGLLNAIALLHKDGVSAVFGDSYFDISIDSTRMPHSFFKPSFSLPFLTNYNYIGNSIFIKANIFSKYAHEYNAECLINNYSLLLALSERENVIHLDEYVLLNEYRTIINDKNIAIDDKCALQSYFGSSYEVEGTNKYELREKCQNKGISVLVVGDDIAAIKKLENDLHNIIDLAYNEILLLKNKELVDLKLLQSKIKYEKIMILDASLSFITSNWFQVMKGYLDINCVGAVTPVILKPDCTIYNGGEVVYGRDIIDNFYYGKQFEYVDDCLFNQIHVREVSVIRSGCMLTTKKALLGIDTSNKVLCSDLMMYISTEIIKNGFKCVFTPYVGFLTDVKDETKDDVISDICNVPLRDATFSDNMKRKYMHHYIDVSNVNDNNEELNFYNSIVVIADKKSYEKSGFKVKERLRGYDGISITFIFSDEIPDTELDNKVCENVIKCYNIKNPTKQFIDKLKQSKGIILCCTHADILESKLNNENILYDAVSIDDTDRKYDVIIPVYNGMKYFEKLFNGVEQTHCNFRLIIIDDCSPDEQVKKYLDDLKNRFDDVKLIRHEENKGFVQSVNDGLRIAENHVAIVNTDVELPECWLERLMMSIETDASVGSATPFTNSGTICSFPDFCKDNELIFRLSVNEIDKAFRKLTPEYITVPTGVGFCMAMNINAIKEVGVLDAESFGKGYCEENDWCRRIAESGYRNVHVNNLFVYHNHGGSFLPEEKKKLIAKNLETLNNKHCDYERIVQSYIALDPVRKYRNKAFISCALMLSDKVKKETYIYFSHNNGGGAQDYIKQKKDEIKAQGKRFTCIYYDRESSLYWLEIAYDDYNKVIKNIERKYIECFLEEFKYDEIVISEILTFPQFEEWLNKVLMLKKRKHFKLRMLIHDFFPICPSYTLLDDCGDFCEIKDIDGCKKCAEKNQLVRMYTNDIENWRRLWKQFLDSCEVIECFSQDSINYMCKVYPQNNYILRPHKVERLRKVEKAPINEEIRVAIIGAINHAKGLDIIEKMADYSADNNLPIKYYIVGYCSRDISRENIIITGKYNSEELPDIMENYKINMIMIPSIWPETFSYTTTEAMMMGLPLMVFNIGAPAERVEKYDAGYIVSRIDAVEAVNELQKWYDGEKNRIEL